MDRLPMPYPEAEKNVVADVFAKGQPSLEETFAAAFIGLGGKFVFCDSEQELIDDIIALYDSRDWKQLLCAEKNILSLFANQHVSFLTRADPKLTGADACITGCEYLVARTGSVLLSSGQNFGRIASVFYPVHIVVAYASQLLPDVDAGIKKLKKKYGNLPSMVNINSGPSRTADIEKTLVTGVHGPAEVFCFLLNG